MFVSHISITGVSMEMSILYDVNHQRYQLLMNLPELNRKWLDINTPFDQQVSNIQQIALNKLSYTATAVNQQGTIVGYGGYFKKTDPNGDGVWIVKPVMLKVGGPMEQSRRQIRQ